MLNKRNIIIAAIITYIGVAWILPFIQYVFHALDRNYIGILNERAPRFAPTTQKQIYFETNEIPYMTSE
jgi:hypothetical protein